MELSKAELATAAAADAAATPELRGAEILVKALQAEQVKYVWGYPGGAVLHIYDAFFKQDTIQHVLVRHEQAAVHAADGYARATGKPGVCFTITGPGLTNILTPLGQAWSDSSNVLVISSALDIRDSAQGGAIIGEYALVFDDSRGSGGTLAIRRRAGPAGAA